MVNVNLFTLLFLVVTLPPLINSFEMTRGQADQFSNPNCIGSSCLKTCSQFFAKCDINTKCKYCICDEQFPTFVSVMEKCVSDEDLESKSAPKYSSLSITDWTEDQFLTADSKGDLMVDYTYTGNTEQRWIYTTTGQIMNLKTMQCIDSHKHSNIQLQQCQIKDKESQQWKCNVTFYGVYQIVKEKELYLGSNSGRLFISYFDPSMRYQWISYNTAPLKRTICERPVVYAGCYRVQDGSFVAHIFEPNANKCKNKQNKECSEEIKISAPIFVGHNYCSLLWDRSSFLINNQPWRTLTGHQENLNISKTDTNIREVTLKIHQQAKITWSGALLKLQIRCQDKLNESFEEHCVFLKFHGKSKIIPMSTLKNAITNVQQLSQSNRYKKSTIALSILVCLLLFLLICGVLFVFRQKLPRWGRNGETRRQAEPFCDREDEEI